MNAEIQKELDTLVEERMSFAKAARSEAMLASGEDRGGVARVPSSRLTVSDVELAPIPGQ